MTKRQRQINHYFCPIDKDVRLLSVACDIEVLNAPNFLKLKHFNNYVSFPLGHLTQ